MKQILWSLVFLQFVTYLLAISIRDSPFCAFCTCNETVNSVTCNKVKFTNNPFNTSSFWNNTAGNASYPYEKIVIQNSDLTRIELIPMSPVKILDLSQNRIQIIDNKSFMNLQNMTELSLSRNYLTSEIFDPNIFQGIYTEGEYLPLRSLKILRLDNNELHTLHQDTFEHIMNLEVLDLHGNPFTVLDTQTVIAISSLAWLQVLDLSYTKLKTIPEHIFHTPKNLSQLNLTGNALTIVPPQLEDAHNLQFLILNENPIVNITKDKGFPVLQNLKILHLCNMPKLARIDDTSLSGLWGLKELHICENPNLIHIGKNALSRIDEGAETENWPDLNKLYLKNNKLSYLDSHLVGRWDKLDVIDITDNAWACECENQWLIDTLLKLIIHNNNTNLNGLWCSAPVEMEGQTFVTIYDKNETMRCLDLYGAHPGKDAAILVGILVGLLVGIPMVLGVLYLRKRNWFGYFDNGPAAFSRKFYNRADPEELY